LAGCGGPLRHDDDFPKALDVIGCLLTASLILINLIADVKLLEPTDLFSQRRVEVILYTIICSPWDVLGDFRPLVTVHFVRLYENELLVRIPW